MSLRDGIPGLEAGAKTGGKDFVMEPWHDEFWYASRFVVIPVQTYL